MNSLLILGILVSIIIFLVIVILFINKPFGKKALAVGAGLMIILSGAGIILNDEPPAAPVYPTFGMKTAVTGVGLINGYIRYYTATNCTYSGVVKTATAYLYTDNNNADVKIALYQWVSNTNAGNLLATCTVRTINHPWTWGWETFNFNTTYSVTAGTKYIIAIWSTGACSVGYVASGNGGVVTLAWGSWPSPLTGEGDQARNYSMYVTYNRPPTQTTPGPTNSSTSIHLTPKLNITVADIDVDPMSVTFASNYSDGTTWVNYQTNSSVANGTYRYSFTGASTNSKKYWWKAYVNDGTTNISNWYCFTTEAAAGGPWVNRAPTFSEAGPGNATTNIALLNRTSVKVSDLDGNASLVCFWSNYTGSWVKTQQNNSVTANTTCRDMVSSWIICSATKYYWKVTAYDGHVNSTAWYYFTTVAGGAYTGTDFYVNGTYGSNGNNGSITNPWKTIEYAVDNVDSGDTLYIMAGTYTPSVQVTIDSISTPSSWLKIQNYNTDKVIIQGDNCPHGSAANAHDGIIYVTSCDYLRVTGIAINHSAQGGITFDTCSHITIDNCSISNNSAFAVKSVDSNNLTIEYNTIYNNFNNWSAAVISQETISLESTDYVNVNNNTMLNNRQLNIDIKGGGNVGKICYNNINTTSGYVNIIGFHCYGGSGVYIDAQGIVKNISIYNNKIYGNNTGIALNTEGTGHFEYIYVYNNVINMTNETGGGVTGTMSGRSAFQILKTGASADIFHHIYIYSNTFITGIRNGYSVLQVGNWVGGQFSSSNLNNVYIVNNIFYTEETAYTRYLMRFGGILYSDGIFIINNNSFYRTLDGGDKDYIYVYWGTTTYNANTNPEKFGYEPVFTDIDFVDAANSDFHISSTSPCIDVGNSTLSFPVVDYDGIIRPQGTYYDIGAYEYDQGGTTYEDIIRNDGTDYFVWLGENTTAYWVNQTIVGMNEATESISIWNRTAWSNGLWQTYNGTRTGVNWTVHTFQVIRTKLDDAVGNQTITMDYNPDMDYDDSQAIILVNTTINKGYNFSAYNRVAATLLSTINTTGIGLTTGDFVAKWNRSTWKWDIWISGFGPHDHDVERWDVIQTKVSNAETWNT